MTAHAMHTTDTTACHIVAETSNYLMQSIDELRHAFNQIEQHIEPCVM